ncbi:MAG: MerC domain-containing protein [Deltaproteobacteria bacterium]|nr:MAG: MerC domain-containing protein [Deltaproteobacteria bacterium]
MQVELIWQRDCPNVTAARRSLMQAFSLTGVPARWREWCLDDDDCPEHARAFGSPSILVDGLDVAGVPAGTGASCRLYPVEEGGFAPAPTPTAIAARLRSGIASTPPPSGTGFSWKRLVAAAPAFAVALLPKVACPACWPAYAGVLSTLGVSFLIDSRYLFASTGMFLAVALFFLGFRASRRRGYGPFALGLVASALLLIGKFSFESDPAMFAGVGLLMGASFWNSWPRKRAASPECAACEPAAPVRPCCDTATPQAPAPCYGSATQGEKP